MKHTRIPAAILLFSLVLCLVSCTGNAATETEKLSATEAVAQTDSESTTVAESESVSEPVPEIPAEGLWTTATYRSPVTLGEGAKTLLVDIVAGNRSLTVTVHTDAANLEDALVGVGLIAGEYAQYGLYIKTVNGILADYDVDASWWSISRDGEDLFTGASGETIEDGAHYALTRK